ncbi:DUF1365 domain-containing protein [Cohaesibacter celericrescens]|uniref:DUF1365 domain-containing protein n=1 Tax=Cohaesibacter celericrescens TaxID=2067669 RepID=A0A2N5XP91_9HYPH|nr:DUF1365 domain-containing protein [Cohaesibacter celericrescens]PLW76313.1 DUF1365 domain-containing protein [Cohaesibacter celericrescens]
MNQANCPSHQDPFRCYKGKVFHQRHDTVQHRLSYDVFSVCLDLGDAENTSKSVPFFSYNGFNLFSIQAKDHMDAGYDDLRLFVQGILAQSALFNAGAPLPERIEMLAYPRFLGRAFNPLTVFFCYDAHDELSAILYQVRNTFGERHHYAFGIADGSASSHYHSCDKKFYVSPFIEMECRYNFRVDVPRDTVAIIINQTQHQKPLLTASFSGKKMPVSAWSMLGLSFSYFQMGWKILAAIHWEALKLWFKGAVYQKRQAPPSSPVTSILPDPMPGPISKGDLS